MSRQNTNRHTCLKPSMLSLLLLLLLPLVQAIGIHYTWQANINPSGIANSIETSHQEYNSLNNNKFFENLIKNPKQLANRIGNEFKLYPYYLAKRNVLLGLIKVIQDDKALLVKLNLPRTSLTLLKFGTPKTELQQWTTGVEDVRGSIGIATTIPILGGCLSLEPEGSLQFKSICNYHSSPSYTLYKHDYEYVVRNHDLNIHLETRIVDYKPSMVGVPPVNRWRKVLYLNTQRYFHVYVMRRFHGHLYSVIENDMKRVESEDVETSSKGVGDSVRAQRFEFNRKSK
ncbi:hypothetical protein CTEN210_18202 [Chaetoceros tenuissimus]|uniref:Uncharacterized protein n=1 Tax=Chaetoceros tenuissimus TaxID=426638 RepID=A0AAD3HFU1_9STRA|nr:hypothetical protein CTEN210_18202 [Chaetoceros tenuissimus]